MNVTQNSLKHYIHSIKLLRGISSLCGNCRQKEKSVGDFTPLYKFPYILPFSLINRLKVYQSALTAVSIPAAVVLHGLGYISSGAVEYTAALGVSGCLSLYSLGLLTHNFIGFIYYNEEKDIVKVSYIDFWGRRKDVELPSKDIVPIDELPVTMLNGLFVTFRRFSTGDTYKFSLRFGIMLDKDKLKQIL